MRVATRAGYRVAAVVSSAASLAGLVTGTAASTADQEPPPRWPERPPAAHRRARVYDRALTATEVADIHAAGSVGLCP